MNGRRKGGEKGRNQAKERRIYRAGKGDVGPGRAKGIGGVEWRKEKKGKETKKERRKSKKDRK